MNTDPAAFKGVWVFCEQREGKLMPTDFELISEGRKLADDLGVELCGLLLGDNVEGLAKELGGYGADSVYRMRPPPAGGLHHRRLYQGHLRRGRWRRSPRSCSSAPPTSAVTWAPAARRRLHTGLTADCTHLDVDVEKYKAFLKTTSTMDVDNIEVRGGRPQPEDDPSRLRRPPDGHHHLPPLPSPDVYRSSRRYADAPPSTRPRLT